ncbi:MAG: hypothetical protein LBR28_06615 [Bacteroidales bacterium]|jgi:hypothetical protein|nr:hypothetical protein [Bacteroidales bacterium]
MKKIFAFTVSILVVAVSFAQMNITDVYDKYSKYFDKIETQKNEILVCTAKNNYDSMLQNDKETLMGDVLKISGYSVSIVVCNQKQEIWTRDINKGILIDIWNLNSLQTTDEKTENKVMSSSVNSSSKLSQKPWFIYLGANGLFGGETSNLYCSTRAGLFLYKNKWDIAASLTLGKNGEAFMFDIGVNSRVYFPLTLKNMKLAPYLGIGLTYNVIGEVSYWDLPIYAGTSWYVGPGSVDLGIQAWKNFAITIGYTFSPRLK